MHEINTTVKEENKRLLSKSKNVDLIKRETKNKYKNLSEKEKNKKRRNIKEKDTT